MQKAWCRVLAAALVCFMACAGDDTPGGKTQSIAAPDGVVAAALSARRITVTWNPVQGAASYKVWYDQGSNPAKLFAGSASAASYSHTGLQPETLYTYYVQAVGSSGNASEYSDLTVHCAARTPAFMASGVTAEAVSESRIDVRWGAFAGATSYKVYYASSPEGSKTLAGTVGTNSYAHTGLQASTTYYYFVKVIDSIGESGYSEPSDDARATTLPAPPVGVAVTELSADSVSVTWVAVGGAANYKVYYASSPDGAKAPLATVGDAAYTHSGIAAGQAYYYFVTTLTASAESVFSGHASLKPNAPGGLAVVGVTATSITVSWGAVPGAGGYRVYYRQGVSGAAPDLAGDAPLPTYTITGLAPGAEYAIYAAAYRAGSHAEYESALSAPVSAVPTIGAPANVRAVRDGSDVAVAWDPVPDAAQYRVYSVFSASAAASPASLEKTLVDTVSGSVTQYAYAPPPASGYYWYFAKAVHSSGIEGGYSAPNPDPVNLYNTVTFMNQGSVHATDLVAAGGTLSEPDRPSSGSTGAAAPGLYLGSLAAPAFLGWYSGEALWDFSAPVYSSMTLIARWSASGNGAATRIASVAGNDIPAAVAYVNANPNAGSYTLLVGANPSTAGQTLSAANARLTIMGLGQERTIILSSSAPLFRVNNASASLTLGENITLRGRLSGTSAAALVQVSAGALAMEGGSKSPETPTPPPPTPSKAAGCMWRPMPHSR